MRIGVFDSGIGGFTVLGELNLCFPEAEFVYFGDTANVPYGPKSSEQIRRLSAACAQRLAREGVDAVVVACNTASSLALPEIRTELPGVPVIGMVEPGAAVAREALPSLDTPVLLLATRATVSSGAYRTALSAQGCTRIVEVACPLLVPMIEEGWIDHPILHACVEEYLGSSRETLLPGVVLLGCTHYPWVEAAIQQALPGWRIAHPAHEVARELEALSNAPANARTSALIPERTKAESRFRWIFSDPASVPAFAQKWMKSMEDGLPPATTLPPFRASDPT